MRPGLQLPPPKPDPDLSPPPPQNFPRRETQAALAAEALLKEEAQAETQRAQQEKDAVVAELKQKVRASRGAGVRFSCLESLARFALGALLLLLDPLRPVCTPDPLPLHTPSAPQYRDLEADKVRAVGEKQASLESMMRAAATATREAALKQEALNNVARELDAVVSKSLVVLVCCLVVCWPGSNHLPCTIG